MTGQPKFAKCLSNIFFHAKDKLIEIREGAFRFIGNLISIGDHYLEELMKHELVKLLKNNLTDEYQIIRVDACWILANIFAGNSKVAIAQAGKIEWVLVKGNKGMSKPLGLIVDVINLAFEDN